MITWPRAETLGQKGMVGETIHLVAAEKQEKRERAREEEARDYGSH